MLMVKTKTCGILKMRKTLSNSVWLVVIDKRITRDTEAITRLTNNAAPAAPCRVITSLNPKIPKENSGAPGVNTLNKAGMAIKSENSGINIQVRFKKNCKSIRDA